MAHIILFSFSYFLQLSSLVPVCKMVERDLTAFLFLLLGCSYHTVFIWLSVYFFCFTSFVIIGCLLTQIHVHCALILLFQFVVSSGAFFVQ